MFNHNKSNSLLLSLTVISTITLIVAPIAAQADSGKELLEKKCVTCHVLPDPHNLTAVMWVDRMESMAPLANLNAQEKEAVLKYLQDNSGTLEELLASEKPYYVKKCSSCHSLDNVPVTTMKGSELEDFLFEHQEDKGGEMDKEHAHEIAEFLLHTKLFIK